MRRSDRRECGRHPCRLSVRFGSADHLRDHYITNIGEGGVFLETLYPLRIGAPVDLEMVIGKDPVSLTVSGEVIWVRNSTEGGEPGMGIRFLEVSPPFRRQLKELLAAATNRGES